MILFEDINRIVLHNYEKYTLKYHFNQHPLHLIHNNWYIEV